MSDVPGAEYCRQIESYLCRRNDGHLIRIVGPAFEKVMNWAESGIPIRIAFRGIDRCVDRERAKGGRRRPVRVEFCETDVLDAFDEWRRAVGPVVGSPTSAEDRTVGSVPTAEAVVRRPHRVALQAHIDRAMARLTQSRLEQGPMEALGTAIDRALAALDVLRGPAYGARGNRREELNARLREVDAQLIAEIRASVPKGDLARVDEESRRSLQAFRDRMTTESFERAVAEETARQLRELFRLPAIAPDL
jgi:hypothetical protein